MDRSRTRGRSRLAREGEDDIRIDDERLARLRRHDSPTDGIYEEFMECRLGSGGSFALLSGPLGKPRDEAWVVCPSIGPEHGNLRRLEAMISRRLSRESYPVLRIRPDVHPVDGLARDIDLAARLHEVEDAVRLVSSTVGARTVGLIGSFFGGTVAALACEQLGASAMVLIEPVPRGKRYLKEIMRRHAVAELVRTANEPGSALPPEPHELADDGSAMLQGLRLSSEEAQRISAVDLVDDITSFRGRSLVIGVSSSGDLSPSLRALRDHLTALGGDVTTAVVEDALFAPFGEYYYRNAGPVRLDTRLELDERVADATACWVLGREVAVPLVATT
jgi:hypothetical protein